MSINCWETSLDLISLRSPLARTSFSTSCARDKKKSLVVRHRAVTSVGVHVGIRDRGRYNFSTSYGIKWQWRRNNIIIISCHNRSYLFIVSDVDRIAVVTTRVVGELTERYVKKMKKIKNKCEIVYRRNAYVLSDSSARARGKETDAPRDDDDDGIRFYTIML